MPSANYQVLITFTGASGSNASGCFSFTNKTPTGFEVQALNCQNGGNLNTTATFSWFAIADR